MNRVATISCPEHSILIAFPAAAGTVESQGQFRPSAKYWWTKILEHRLGLQAGGMHSEARQQGD
jgi:hypothetical protein